MGFNFIFQLYKLQNQTMLLELEDIFGQRSAHSFAVGPVIADPVISPRLLTKTPALSSKYTKMP